MDDLELIQRVLPPEEGPSHDSWAQARARLVAVATDEPPVYQSRPARRRRTLVPTLGLGAVAVAVVVGLLIASTIRGGASRPATASAAAVLHRAANAALVSPLVGLGPSRWWYNETVDTYLATSTNDSGTIGVYINETEQYWIGPDRWVRRDHLLWRRPEHPITRPWQREAFQIVGPNPSTSGNDEQFDTTLSYAQLLHVPRGTAALSQLLIGAETSGQAPVSPRDRESRIVEGIQDALTNPLVPGRARAALFRLAATLPGAQLLGRTHDRLGRPAITIEFTFPRQDERFQFLFDPRSYVLLGDRETSVRHPHVIDQNIAFVASGFVDRPGAVALPLHHHNP